MDIQFKKLNKDDLQKELDRVKSNITHTEETLQLINSISPEEIEEIKKIISLIEKSKVVGKKESKEKYLVYLNERKTLLENAIEEMTLDGREFYNE